MHIWVSVIMIFKGNMSLNIPDHLKKYCSLSEDATIIDRFKCPVPGCSYSTRLGPGAVRMHILIKADPQNESRYSSEHEEYFKENEPELSMDNIRILSNIPYRPISYKKE
jgi:hypothetical protein